MRGQASGTAQEVDQVVDDYEADGGKTKKQKSKGAFLDRTNASSQFKFENTQSLPGI